MNFEEGFNKILNYKTLDVDQRMVSLQFVHMISWGGVPLFIFKFLGHGKARDP